MKKIIVIALAAFATFTLSAQTLGKVNFNELVMLMPEMDVPAEAGQLDSGHPRIQGA